MTAEKAGLIVVLLAAIYLVIHKTNKCDKKLIDDIWKELK